MAIRVTPRAKKTEIQQILSDGTIKIRLAAPPVEGKANQALVAFLADVLGVRTTQIEIVAGESGRDKRVAVTGLEAEVAHERILAALEGERGN